MHGKLIFSTFPTCAIVPIDECERVPHPASNPGSFMAELKLNLILPTYFIGALIQTRWLHLGRIKNICIPLGIEIFYIERLPI